MRLWWLGLLYASTTLILGVSVIAAAFSGFLEPFSIAGYTTPLVLTTCLCLAEIIDSHDSRPLSSRGQGRGFTEDANRRSLSTELKEAVRFVLGLTPLPAARLMFLFTASVRLSQVLHALIINALGIGSLSRADCGNSTPNPDIAGSGVRCSMYILLLFVFVSLAIASFHRQQSGTKELVCTVLINLCAMSLSLALVKPSNFTPTDYLVVVLMIDTQCVALSAVLSSKDALASRWYVGFTLLGQSFAWTVVAYANQKLANSLSPPATSCLSEVWLMSSMGDGWPIIRFQTYWYFHAIDLVHSGWLALRHTVQFDKLEKIDRKQQRSGRSTDAPMGFESLRGKPFSNWLGFCLHPILLIVTLETHLNGIDTPAWGDWGQMMPLTMLILGVGHWFYVNLTQLDKYIKARAQPAHAELIIPLDTPRMVAMGYKPSTIGEVVHQLFTADRSDL